MKNENNTNGAVAPSSIPLPNSILFVGPQDVISGRTDFATLAGDPMIYKDLFELGCVYQFDHADAFWLSC